MSDLIVLPTVLPALTAAFLLLAVRYDLKRQRLISVTATAGLLALAIVLYGLAGDGVPRPYLLGDWPAPFGIVLVLDRLSATMLVLAAALALCVVLYAINGWDERGRHFHPLFQFQLLGINGAFLTGDVFNLFVFFEVMLIASYGLLLHGGGPRRLRAGFQYVTINLLASTLFLFAVGLIYAVTGTLNMADLAVKAPLVSPSDAALLRIGALLLFLVFAIKAALVP
ncbi:MAG TPA: proton-conducting transporter membrane subunit, partial [Stellaceae bacterium]|nr:proton-conducting transporter membrane subunit [Stellaceae bacterium]